MPIDARDKTHQMQSSVSGAVAGAKLATTMMADTAESQIYASMDMYQAMYQAIRHDAPQMYGGGWGWPSWQRWRGTPCACCTSRSRPTARPASLAPVCSYFVRTSFTFCGARNALCESGQSFSGYARLLPVLQGLLATPRAECFHRQLSADAVLQTPRKASAGVGCMQLLTIILRSTI